MNRAGMARPMIVLAFVTALLAGYGSHPWSFLAGPVAALIVWSLGEKTQETATSASASAQRGDPALVD